MATGIVATVILATKFADGAWITVSAILFLVFLFFAINRHYRRVAEQLGVPGSGVVVREIAERRAVLLPVESWNQGVRRALEAARGLGRDITAIHIAGERDAAEPLSVQWHDAVPDVPLVILESPYRSLITPVVWYVEALQRGGFDEVIVVLPTFVPAHFWQSFLHNQLSKKVKRALTGRDGVLVAEVAYELR